jgi:hypothetical protein
MSNLVSYRVSSEVYTPEELINQYSDVYFSGEKVNVKRVVRALRKDKEMSVSLDKEGNYIVSHSV